MTAPQNLIPFPTSNPAPTELSGESTIGKTENFSPDIESLETLLPNNSGHSNKIDFYPDHRLVNSTFAMCVVVYLVINLGLSFFSPFSFDPYKFPYRGWMWWTFNDLRKNPQLHNIALLGSSLMVSATAGSEANYLNRKIDNTSYHQNKYLDDKLTYLFGGRFSTFNLSAPGQMPSDALLSLKAMINIAERPDIVIYGIAPRDFLDSTLASPLNTEHFRYLRRLVNVDDIVTGLFRSIFEKLDWWLGRNFYLYGSSLDFKMLFTDAIQDFANRFIPTPATTHPFTWWDRVRLIPNYVPGEIHAEAIMTSPIKSTGDVHWTDNTKEYIERYRKPDPNIYHTQFYFLQKLAQYCHRERIELVLVNMPLTSYNIGLLNAQTYFNYMEALLGFGAKNNVPVVNLCDLSHYQNSDFHDSVHLNGFGGKKFFDALVLSLNDNQRTKEALILASQELSRQEAIRAGALGDNK
jgi:hypothetical protein